MQAMFGKNIIITDNTDWTTRGIVEASPDRRQVEDRFRLNENEDLVSTRRLHQTQERLTVVIDKGMKLAIRHQISSATLDA